MLFAASPDSSLVAVRSALRSIAADPAYIGPVRQRAAVRATELSETTPEPVRAAEAEWASASKLDAVEQIFDGPARVWGKVKSPLVEELANHALTALGTFGHHDSPTCVGIRAALETGSTQDLVHLLRGGSMPNAFHAGEGKLHYWPGTRPPTSRFT